MKVPIKKAKLWLPVAVLLIILIVIMFRGSIGNLAGDSNQTPIPPQPEHPKQISEPNDHSKIDIYEKEIEEGKRSAFTEEPDLEVVSIPWDKVFAHDQKIMMENAGNDTLPADTKKTDTKPEPTVAHYPVAPKKLLRKKRGKTSKQQKRTRGFNTTKPPMKILKKHEPRLEVFLSAVIHGNQKVTDGGTIVFRVIDELKLDTILILRNTMLYAVADISADRLKATVRKIKTQKFIYPIQLTMLDQDLLPGIALEDNWMAEGAESLSDEVIDQVTGYQHRGVINSLKRAFKGGGKNRSIWLEDGYRVYFHYSSTK